MRPFLCVCLAIFAPSLAAQPEDARAARLWSLQPVERPEVPGGATRSANPIDAFIAAGYQGKGLVPVAKADKLTLLRRIYFDLIGLPPTPYEQSAFLADSSPDA